MKRNRIFIGIVLFLLVFNLLFYGLFYIADGKNYVKEKLIHLLEKELNARVQIQDFSINDRQITANGISIIDKSHLFNVQIKQIYVEYNPVQLLFAKMKLAKTIHSINIYEPNIQLTIKPSKKKSSNKSTIEIESLFRNMNITRGILNISYLSPSLNIQERFNNIDVRVKNSSDTQIYAKVHSYNKGIIESHVVLKKGKLRELQANIKNYNPYRILNSYTKRFNGYLNSYVEYEDNVWSINGALQKVQFRLQDKVTDNHFTSDFASASILFKGNQNQLSIISPQITYEKTKAKLDITVNSIFSKIPKIKGQCIVDNFQLKDLVKEINGSAHADIQVNGNIKNLALQATLQSQSIIYQNQKISNITIKTMTNQVGKEPLAINLINADWNNNHIAGIGTVKTDDFALDFHIKPTPIQYADKRYMINTTAEMDLSYSNKGLLIKPVLHDLSFINEQLSITGMQLSGSLLDNKVDFYVTNQEGISLHILGDIANMTGNIEAQLKNIDLNHYLKADIKDLPRISGLLTIQADEKVIYLHLDSQIKSRKLINGGLVVNGDLQRKDNAIHFCMESNSLKIQAEPVELTIEGNGNTKEMAIHALADSTVIADAVLNFEPQIQYSVNSDIQNLKLSRILSYFAIDKPENYQGLLNGKIHYSSQNKGNLHASLQIDSLAVNQSAKLSAQAEINGNQQHLVLDKLEIQDNKQTVLSVKGYTNNTGESVQLNATIPECDISSVYPIDDFAGKIQMQASFSKKKKDMQFSLNLRGKQFTYNKLTVDSLQINMVQTAKNLFINKFQITTKDLINISGQGCIAYNMFTNKSEADSSTILVKMDGDPFRILPELTSVFKHARGKLNSKIIIGTGDEGVYCKYGSMDITDGDILIDGQQEAIEKITAHLELNKNQIQITRCKMQMGNGTFYLHNVFDGKGTPFTIGEYSLGCIRFHTNEEGILFHMPLYMPSNSVSNVVIKGRYLDDAEVEGPFNDMKIKADVYVSNGSGIYPSKTENLLQLFNLFKKTETESEEVETEDYESSELPFTMDLMLHFTNNVRYATYPTDFLVIPTSYLHITYENGEWFAKDAQIASESGTLEIFGTVFDVDYIQFIISPFQPNPKLTGTFYKKAPDGTVITLSVYSKDDRDLSFLESFEFKLSSDNSSDRSMTEILAKLRYGRSLEELSGSQQQTILQDEAVNLIGVSISSAFLDPFMSPIENKIRKALKLDAFSINPGFIQNFFEEYQGSDNVKLKNTKNEIANFGSSIFLDNLSIDMGRYISRNLFLSYKAFFQETNDLDRTSNLFMYNTFSLRLDLPKQFHLSYKFQLKPAKEKDTHEILLERSFRFW